MGPDRVLLVLHEELLGGASRATLRALEPLVENGLEVHVWCARPSPLYDELDAAGWHLAGAPRPLRYSLAGLRRRPGVARRLMGVPGSLAAFARHLRRVKPDLVHANSTLSLPEGALARAAGYPVLFHYHDSYGPGRRLDVVRRAAWAVGHEVAALSQWHAETLAWRGRRPRVLPSPARVPAEPPPAAGEPVVVASVGALGPRKGTDLFIDAAELLAGSGVRFEIVGGDEDAPSPEWAAEQLERARRAGVVYRERVDVQAELARWAIVAAPSRMEPFGLVVLEAMAAARAVVGARVGGIAELLDGGAGVLVPPDDARALAAAIAELAANPERRAALGEAARERARGYDVGHAAERLAAAYEAATGAARRSRTGRRRARR